MSTLLHFTKLPSLVVEKTHEVCLVKLKHCFCVHANLVKVHPTRSNKCLILHFLAHLSLVVETLKSTSDKLNIPRVFPRQFTLILMETLHKY